MTNIFSKLLKISIIFIILMLIVIGKTYADDLFTNYEYYHYNNTSSFTTNSFFYGTSIKNLIYGLSFQNNDNEDANNDSTENEDANNDNENNNTSNDGDSDEEVNIDEVNNNDNPVWELTQEKTFENPVRRFEIIFLASFSYLFFLNVTIIETVTQLVPADYGQGLLFERDFTKALIFYTFASSIVFALAVAIEDIKFVYFENIPKNKNENKNKKIEEDNKLENKNNISFYFAPKINFNTDGDIAFRLFLLNF